MSAGPAVIIGKLKMRNMRLAPIRTPHVPMARPKGLSLSRNAAIFSRMSLLSAMRLDIQKCEKPDDFLRVLRVGAYP